MRGERSNITHWIDWTTFEPRPEIDYHEEPDPENAVDIEHARRIVQHERRIAREENTCDEDARYRDGASERAKACKEGCFPEVMERRERIARLLAERGPLRTIEIMRATGCTEPQVYAAQRHSWFRREGKARACRIALTVEGLQAIRGERVAS